MLIIHINIKEYLLISYFVAVNQPNNNKKLLSLAL